MNRLLLLLLLFLFIHCCANAQQPSLYFDRITIQNGLSHNKVNCILQDKRGFIWIGTDDGLNRYDGSHFTIFKNKPGDNSTISGNIVTDLLEDDQEVLWIATADGGLTKYDYRLLPSKQFIQYKHLPGDSQSIPVNIINKLLQDDNGCLWLATSGHYVVRFDKKTGHFTLPVKTGTKTILALTKAGNNEIWVGKQGGGLLKIDTKTFAFQADSRYSDLYAKLPHATVTSLFKDHTNNIWYGSWDKVLYQYNRQLQREIVFEKKDGDGFNNDDVLGFAEDKAGNIWMAGRYNGVHVYEPHTGKFYNYTNDPSRDGTIPGNQVNCIFIDKQGILWAGTNKGIGRSNPLQQQFNQVFLDKGAGDHIAIYDFYETDNKDCWLATSAGIFIRKYGSSTFTKHALFYKHTPLLVSKFYKDAAGRFFIGTNYSLFILNPADFSIQPLPNTEKDGVMNHIIQSYIVAIAEDSIDGKPVLITSPYGHYITYYSWDNKKWISRLDSNRQIVYRYNIKDNLVRKIYKSNTTGNLFIATAKEGLGIWKRGKKQRFDFFKNDPQQKDVLGNNNVYDIAEDEQSNLWLTTYGGGLHYFNPNNGSATHIAASNNLLEGIETDRNGNLWIISNGNIDKYNPAFQSYTSFQLPDIEKSGGVHGRVFKDREGQLYVAGDGYFISFDPLAIKENKVPPPVFLTDFKIFNQSHSHLLSSGDIWLPYDQNYINVEFAAPVFTPGTAVQYQYKLTGLNNEWTDIGTENKVSFSNLPANNYEFKVRATNRPGVWYENAASIRIVIMKPFWQRWWFYVLCALAIAGIVYAVYNYRVNEILNRQAIRNKIAQDLHDNIGSTLSSISVYSQVAKIYRQQHKDQQLQETLEKISETAADMISEMSDIVWTINPRNDNMEMILQRMESYAKPLLASKSITFHFNYDPQIRTVNPGMTQRKNFYLIFKETINNAMKYADCNNLYVTVKKEHQHIEMKMTDDGIGFDASGIRTKTAQSLSGNGLQNILLRAKEMKGSCDIISSPGKGTTLTLRFPVT